MEIAFPFHLDDRGRLAEADDDAHVEQLIEQLLFTSPGQRVNRPTFGCGLIRLVFAPADSEVATANQFLVQGELQQWLGDRIQVQGVRCAAQGDELTVTVQYRVQRTERMATATYRRRVPLP